jgi:hypothetical protein
VHAAITAATGFLIAVLWFDLMFDVQVVPHLRAPEVPRPVVQSIATYYRRVTTDSRPMSALVALTMLALLVLLVWQASRGDIAGWASVVSLAGAGAAIVLALGRVVPDARRLGAQRDTEADQARLARRIFADHVLFLALMVAVLVVQLAA